MARTPDVDVLAVQHDGVLINALAVRGDLDAFAADPVADLLVSWVQSIDEGIDDSAAWVMPEQEWTRVTPRRQRGRAGLVAGVTAAVLVVSSGAAAAVTGDALAIVRAPIEVLGRVSPFHTGQDEAKDGAKDGLPEPAAPVAEPNKLLADVRRALAQGDKAEATRLLAQAQDLLGDAVNPGQQHRIDKLTSQLGTESQGKGKETNQGKGSKQEPGTSASGNQGKHSTRAHGTGKLSESPDAGKPKSGKGTAKGTDESKSGGQKP